MALRALCKLPGAMAFRNLVVASSLTGLLPDASGAADAIPLAGTWRFQLDAHGTGVDARWFARQLEDTIELPGTTDENRKGIATTERAVDRLSRVWYWKGPAWYQRDVTIPESWAGKRVTLFLERTKNTRVWIDDRFRGWDDTLSAPQVFDVTTAMTPGTHTITLLVDNSRLPPVGPSHAVDERTQTNWNGVVGRLELRATDPVWIADVQVFPDAASRQARVHMTIGNITGQTATGRVTLTAGTAGGGRHPESGTRSIVPVRVPGTEKRIEFTHSTGAGVPLWDEFRPSLADLHITLETTAGGNVFTDRRPVRFGMRDFTRDGNRLKINGRTVFLRGRVDCANYPLTGYAPMDKAEWRRILSIQKDWGINHVRFHSWCPPEAAFAAADELGIYLQPEIPSKRSGYKAPEDQDAARHNIDRLDVESAGGEVSLYDYAKREGELIFKAFGNHPSFVMFTLGNELGRNKGMFELVAHFRAANPRCLHAQGSNNMHWNPSLAAGDDFWVTAKTARDKPVRGAFYLHDNPDGHVENRPPSTMVDFSDAVRGIPVPVVGHETGAFQVAPDYRDIPKFTGVLRARNYEVFRERVAEAGLLDQAHDFVRASGALAAICYREDIEAALRTPDLSGFQLLDLMDFPGQGTALVGMLNVFLEDKGVIDPASWRRFCSGSVPLLRMKKFTWTTDETLIGRVQVAHYGPSDIADARVTWTVENSAGTTLGGGAFDPTLIKTGQLSEIDMCALPLSAIVAPQKLTVRLAIEGTPCRNDYPIWVYPPDVETGTPGGVMVTRSFSASDTQAHLAGGGRVLLLPLPDQLPHSVEGSFQTDYWSPMFAAAARKRGLKEPPGTLGILCDPNHPALARFPTEFHSHWQWWHLVKNARPLVLDDTPEGYRPTVQVIDNFVRNHKLGLVAETRVGPGSLLICTIDLPGQQDKPEARQLLHSLLRYVGSHDFAPEIELDPALLRKLLPGQTSQAPAD